MKTAIALLACLLLASCAHQQPSLAGTQWLAEDIDGRGVIDNAQSTLEFTSDNRVAGRAGCNRYGGSVKLDGAKLKIEQVFATKMACAPALMDQETRFLQALEAASSFEVKDTKLLVKDASGKQRLLLDRQ